jgi:hypothetical protein
MDNQGTLEQDNSTTQTQEFSSETSTTTATPPASTGMAWKDMLKSDLKNSPLIEKFGNDVDGLNMAIESHANLEKLLGHEKVPIPKGPEDMEGWSRFSKAMGIPDKAEGYGLPDPTIPETMKPYAIDKQRFAEVVHAHKLTPAQAQGLWKIYNDTNVESYNKAVQDHEKSMNETINRLRGEWGDTYETNVELGQMVINKFSADQEMNDYITAVLSKDPRGIKFLAKIGDQFAENKVGEFQMKRFSLGPEQAMDEIDKIVKDPKHPYNSLDASPKEHEAAVNYVNGLYQTVNKAKRQA